jgi:hypothetical protein
VSVPVTRGHRPAFTVIAVGNVVALALLVRLQPVRWTR